jgi:hypothetical protein
MPHILSFALVGGGAGRAARSSSGAPGLMTIDDDSCTVTVECATTGGAVDV